MWYLIWFIGVLLACCLAVITGLWVDRVEGDEK